MKGRMMALAAGIVFAAAAMASAHGPSRLKTEMSVTLDATPDEVWQAIGQFDDMSWHPAVASTQMQPEGAPADQPDEFHPHPASERRKRRSDDYRAVDGHRPAKADV